MIQVSTQIKVKIIEDKIHCNIFQKIKIPLARKFQRYKEPK